MLEGGEEAGERFARVLLPDLAQCFRRPPLPPGAELRAERWPLTGLVLDGGHIFTDGACFDAEFPTLRVAGWAVVAYDADFRLLGSLRGVVPRNLCPSQSARDGEDRVETGPVLRAKMWPNTK